jgi:hypothetical protein
MSLSSTPPPVSSSSSPSSSTETKHVANNELEFSCTAPVGLRTWFSEVHRLVDDPAILTHGLHGMNALIVRRAERESNIAVFERREAALFARIRAKFNKSLPAKGLLEALHTKGKSFKFGEGPSERQRCVLSNSIRSTCRSVYLFMENDESSCSEDEYLQSGRMFVQEKFISLLVAYLTVAQMRYFIVDRYVRHLYKHGNYTTGQRELEEYWMKMMRQYDDCFCVAWHTASH